MNNYQNISNNVIWKELASLHQTIDKQRKEAIKKRLEKNPKLTNIEYLLGAFMEMYQPHLHEIIKTLYSKGYAIDVTSGFNGKNSEMQSLIGHLNMDYITRNKLEKLGMRHREYDGFKCYIFWPEKADIKYITDKWEKIVKALPDKGELNSVYLTYETTKFRRKYAAHDPGLLQKQHFEKLRFEVLNKTEKDLAERKKKNNKPTNIELALGFFIEELEPQVRDAVLALHKKGYSTDISGFMDNPLFQIIEGDFQLDEETLAKFQTDEIIIETNPSGYTRLKMTPDKADLASITKKWNKVIERLPDTKKQASASMTRKARDFRIQYS